MGDPTPKIYKKIASSRNNSVSPKNLINMLNEIDEKDQSPFRSNENNKIDESPRGSSSELRKSSSFSPRSYDTPTGGKQGNEYAKAQALFRKLQDDREVVATSRLQDYLKAQGMSDEWVARALDHIDINHDNELTWTEFATKGIRVIEQIQLHEELVLKPRAQGQFKEPHPAVSPRGSAEDLGSGLRKISSLSPRSNENSEPGSLNSSSNSLRKSSSFTPRSYNTPEGGKQGNEYAKAQALFRKLEDEREIVSRTSLQKYLHEQGMSDEWVANALDHIDVNHDNELTWAEFATKGIRVIEQIQLHEELVLKPRAQGQFKDVPPPVSPRNTTTSTAHETHKLTNSQDTISAPSTPRSNSKDAIPTPTTPRSTTKESHAPISPREIISITPTKSRSNSAANQESFSPSSPRNGSPRNRLSRSNSAAYELYLSSVNSNGPHQTEEDPDTSRLEALLAEAQKRHHAQEEEIHKKAQVIADLDHQLQKVRNPKEEIDISTLGQKKKRK
eukprot:Phypoly_transcript_04391.p1 GENE.Phypoly_transcript_04391~~Phypoly_transcript_04391.p1  ORF type:complete len:540 (+),score=104.98 Phypoly_transcript_04391:113-1621(+)